MLAIDALFIHYKPISSENENLARFRRNGVSRDVGCGMVIWWYGVMVAYPSHFPGSARIFDGRGNSIREGEAFNLKLNSRPFKMKRERDRDRDRKR